MDSTTENPILAARNAYAARGWKTLPLTNGKSPIGIARWQSRTFDATDFATATGVGVQLGPCSGIIDAEWDNPAQQAKLIELAGELPPGPEFKSSKGGHKLFARDERLEAVAGATVDFECADGTTLKIRVGAGGKGAQSAFPPSPGKAWLPGTEAMPAPAAPEALIVAMLAAAKPKTTATGPAEWSEHEFPADSLTACRVALAKLPDAVEGENGSGKMMAAMNCIRRHVGNYDQALELAHEFNEGKCIPPFDDPEVERKLNESDEPPRQHPTDVFDAIAGPPIFSIGDLIAAHAELRPPLLDGLCRHGETVNVVSDPKVGKSWLAYGLGLSINTGRRWLDRFPTRRGRVLLVDNELHRETLAGRIPKVANAMRIDAADYVGRFDVMPLRGQLRGIGDLASDLNALPRGAYSAIILDAKYRFALGDADENSNAWQAAFYNQIDKIADRTGAAVFLVSHASKGDQSGKRITDVGAGGGAQARAADCHLVLRPHEDDGVFVLDAVVRSFPPVKPLAIRWEYPQWFPAGDSDPARLRRPPSPRLATQASEDAQGRREILATLGSNEASVREICRRLGMGHPRAQKLLCQLELAGQVVKRETRIRGNDCEVYACAA